MKRLILFLIPIVFLACATIKPCVCPDCPPEDVVIIDGQDMPTKIGKGWLIPENYFTMEEWEKLMMEYYNRMHPKKGI